MDPVMKLRSLSAVVVFLAGALSALAGTVNILPLKPKEGQTVTIEYKPDAPEEGWIKESSSIHATLFGFSEEAEAPNAVDVRLSKNGNGVWTGTTELTKGIVFTLVKVGNGLIYDTNKGTYWSFLTYGANGSAVRNANLKAAYSCFGMLPTYCRRKEDMQEAVDYLQNEVKLQPRAITARVNLAMLQKALGEKDEKEVEGELREIIRSTPNPSTPMEALAISQAYMGVGDQGQSFLVQRNAALRFPRSKVDEQMALQKLSESPNAQSFISKVSSHLEDYPNTFAKQNLLDMVVTTAGQQRDVTLLIPFTKHIKDLPASVCHSIANYLGAVDSLRPEALALVERGLVAAKDQSLRPVYAGPAEWNEEQRMVSSQLLYVKGAILRAMGQKKEALAALEKSIDVGGRETDKGTYEAYVKLLQESGEGKKAVGVAETAIRNGAATAGLYQSYREMRKADGKDSASIEKDLAALRVNARRMASTKLAKDMLNQTGIAGTFTTPEGAPVNIGDWKGKVVLIDYWATWCGPCRSSFPAVQKLYERYRSNPNVVFAVVNVWERDKDRQKIVKDFLSKNTDLTFPVYLDATDAVVGKFGVTGIPTKFYLGKDGRIQFKEVGYLPEEQFLEEATNKIEALLDQELP